jgi:hypothetical protein
MSAVASPVASPALVDSPVVDALAPAISAAEPVVAAGLTSDLHIGTWTWHLPSSGTGTARLDAQIYNLTPGTGTSGSLGLQLRLSTQPYGMGGVYYNIVNYEGLQPLSDGYVGEYWAANTFNLLSVPVGSYYIVAAVTEFTGSEYTVVDGLTASSMYSISLAPPSEPVLPAEPDLAAPDALLKGKALVKSGAGYKFTVTYLDAGGLTLTDVDTNDVFYSNPNSDDFLPQILKVKANRKGTKCAVTYYIAAPAGKWYLPDNGIYTITLSDGAMSDLSGNAVVGGDWTFLVQSKKPSPFVTTGSIRPEADAPGAGLARVAEEILTGATGGASFRAAV